MVRVTPFISACSRFAWLAGTEAHLNILLQFPYFCKANLNGEGGDGKVNKYLQKEPWGRILREAGVEAWSSSQRWGSLCACEVPGATRWHCLYRLCKGKAPPAPRAGQTHCQILCTHSHSYVLFFFFNKYDEATECRISDGKQKCRTPLILLQLSHEILAEWISISHWEV